MNKLLAIANVVLAAIASVQVQAIDRLIGNPTGMLDPNKRRHLESNLNHRSELQEMMHMGPRGGTADADSSGERKLFHHSAHYYQPTPRYQYQSSSSYYKSKKDSSKGKGYSKGYSKGYGKGYSKGYSKGKGSKKSKKGYSYDEPSKYCEMFVEEEHFRFQRSDSVVAPSGNTTDPGTTYLWGGLFIEDDSGVPNTEVQIQGQCTRTTSGDFPTGVCAFTLIDSSGDQLQFSGVLGTSGGNLLVTGGSGSFVGSIGDAKTSIISIGDGDPFDDAVFYEVFLSVGLIVCPPQSDHDDDYYYHHSDDYYYHW